MHLVIFRNCTWIVITLLFCFASCNQQYKKKYAYKDTLSAQRVEVKHLQPSKKALPIHTIGTLNSKSRVPLSFKTGGIIKKVSVEEGSEVYKGQSLAKLDLTEINAQLLKAQNAYQKAKRDFQRTQALYTDSAATKEQLQNAETALEIANSDLQIAEFNQEHSVIRAPFAGTVLRQNGEEGQVIASGTPVIILGSKSDEAMVLEASLSDSDVYLIEIGDSCTIHFDALPNKFYLAKVTLIPDAAEATTGAYKIELSIQNVDPQLKNGLIGKANIFPKLENSYYKIPTNALVGMQQGKAMFFTPQNENMSAKLQSIVPKFLGTDFIAVNSDSLNTPTVIVAGAAYLEDGEPITVSKP